MNFPENLRLSSLGFEDLIPQHIRFGPGWSESGSLRHKLTEAYELIADVIKYATPKGLESHEEDDRLEILTRISQRGGFISDGVRMMADYGFELPKGVRLPEIVVSSYLLRIGDLSYPIGLFFNPDKLPVLSDGIAEGVSWLKNYHNKINKLPKIVFELVSWQGIPPRQEKKIINDQSTLSLFLLMDFLGRVYDHIKHSGDILIASMYQVYFYDERLPDKDPSWLDLLWRLLESDIHLSMNLGYQTVDRKYPGLAVAGQWDPTGKSKQDPLVASLFERSLIDFDLHYKWVNLQ